MTKSRQKLVKTVRLPTAATPPKLAWVCVSQNLAAAQHPVRIFSLISVCVYKAKKTHTHTHTVQIQRLLLLRQTRCPATRLTQLCLLLPCCYLPVCNIRTTNTGSTQTHWHANEPSDGPQPNNMKGGKNKTDEGEMLTDTKLVLVVAAVAPVKEEKWTSASKGFIRLRKDETSAFLCFLLLISAFLRTARANRGHSEGLSSSSSSSRCFQPLEREVTKWGSSLFPDLETRPARF